MSKILVPRTLTESLEWMEDKELYWRYKIVGMETPETSEPYVLCTSTMQESLETGDSEPTKAKEQIDKLASVLLKEFGGPTEDESACEMAVRLLRAPLRATRSNEDNPPG